MSESRIHGLYLGRPCEISVTTQEEVPDPFTWMAQCVTCGQVHERHPAEPRGVRGFQPLAWTWADPDDGHIYRPRYAGMTKDRADGLRDEYEADCAR